MTLPIRFSCFFVAGPLLLLAVPAAAQSFNCHKAFFADEKTICQEPRLSRLDSELATLFGHVSSRLAPTQRAALKRDETAWVVARRRCGHDGPCIAGFYERRIRQLDARLAANEPADVGRTGTRSLPTRTPWEPSYPERNSAAQPSAPMPSQARRRPDEKREPPAVVSTKIPRPSGYEPSTAASGSAAPVRPSHDFDIEPEVSPARSAGSDESAGGPMTPAR